jgi:TfoX/Sxy family transcriptional regulator of competence genes
MGKRGTRVSTDQGFVDFIIDQTGTAGSITYKKMFGEYALYCDGQVVALVCGNKLYVKPTNAGRDFIGAVVEAKPYPSASPRFLIEDKIDDRKWLSKLMKITADELLTQKTKKNKK